MNNDFITYYKENSDIEDYNARNDGYRYIQIWFKNKKKLDSFVKAILKDRAGNPQEYASLRYVLGIQNHYTSKIFIRLRRWFHNVTSEHIKMTFDTFEESKSYIEWMVQDRKSHPDKYKGKVLRIKVKDK